MAQSAPEAHPGYATFVYVPSKRAGHVADSGCGAETECLVSMQRQEYIAKANRKNINLKADCISRRQCLTPLRDDV